MKIKFIVLMMSSAILLSAVNCGRPASQRKIKLSTENVTTESGQQLTTTIHLEPTKRRSVAVMFFQNETGDQNLEWLKKGLTEMFIRSLSQSQYLSVLTTERLFETLERIKETSDVDQFDMEMAAIVAREANVETVLTGSIVKNGDSLQINVKLQDPNRGMVLKEESAEGPGLETLFSMVDNLTQQIKQEMQIAMEKGERERGIAELSTYSLEAWRYYTIGEDYYNKLLNNEAMEQFEKAVEYDPEFVAAHLKLFESYLNQRKNNLAVQTLQNLQSLKKKSTRREQLQIELFDALLQLDINMMLQKYQEWLDEFPDDVEANYNVANLFYGLHQYDKAIQYYQKTLEIDPNNKLVMNMLGYSYAQSGEFEKAISCLENYLKIAPDEPNPYDSLGELYLYLGEYKKAEKLFKKAVRVNDDFNPSWNHLANVYLDQGKYQRAEAIFHESLKRIPEGPLQFLNYNNIAVTCARSGQSEKAIEYFRLSLENNPFQFYAIERLFELYSLKMDTVKVHEVLQQYYEKMIQSSDSTVLLDQNFDHLTNFSFRFNKNIDQSIQYLENLFQQSSSPLTQIRLHLQMMVLYIKSGKKTEMRNSYQQMDHSRFFQVFKDIRQIGYNDVWEHLFYLNRLLYDDLEEGIASYRELIQSAQENDSKMFEVGFRLMFADLLARQNNYKAMKEEYSIVGMPEESQWMVIGPFKNTNGFQKQFPPEKRIDLKKTVRSKQGLLKWKPVDDGANDGHVNFREMYHPYNWSVAYGVINVHSPDRREVEFRVGSNEAVKVWLNKKEVWRLNVVRNAVIDGNIVPVILEEGQNQILIKVCNRTSYWGFYFRITDKEGNGFDDIVYSSAREEKVALHQ